MRGLAVLMPILLFATPAPAGETIRLYAAGSLKAAMGDIVRAFQDQTGEDQTGHDKTGHDKTGHDKTGHDKTGHDKTGHVIKVESTFGASGLLRERIEAGEAAHVFASADMGHPDALAAAGMTRGKARVFARNTLCLLARSGLAVRPESMLEVLLDPSVRVGMSTPKADPSGDYALALFAKADVLQPGARAALEAKAMRLTGGPQSEKAPEGRNLYGWIMEQGKADVFLTYCTNAVLAKAEVPSLRVVETPVRLEVGADYGIVELVLAPAGASRFVDFVAGEKGQAILATYGFGRADAAGK